MTKVIFRSPQELEKQIEEAKKWFQEERKKHSDDLPLKGKILADSLTFFQRATETSDEEMERILRALTEMAHERAEENEKASRVMH
ncbi:MAG: hypothetical protein LBQ08_05050 [Holosporaceae bacterium]|jgi:hypothetical protein|nr:hypothetical protein [Holosporaceae bacterium]